MSVELTKDVSVSEGWSIASRIEGLPATRWLLKIKAIVAAATFFDAFDAIAIAFTLPVLVGLWHLHPTEIGLLISAGFTGQALGAIFFGWLSERFGRIWALQWTIGFISLFGLACAFSWGYWPLVLFRFLQGLGVGGEVPVAATFVSEISSAARRGRSVLLYQFSYAGGFVAASLGSTVIVPLLGWRWMFVFGALPAVIIIALRRSVPESPRWLIRKGRHREAEEIMSRIERIAAQEGARSSVESIAVDVRPQEEPDGVSWTELFGGVYLRRTISVWIMWFCAAAIGYGLLAWLPTIFRTVYHMTVEQSLTYSILGNVTIVAGALLSVIFIDKIGRRPIFIASYLLSGVVLISLSLYENHSAQTLMIVCAGASTLIAMAQLALWAYTPEIYPTRIRAIGTGFASASARVASVVAPMLIGFVLERGGINAIFLMLGIVGGIGALAVVIGCIETNKRSLEDASV